MLFVCVFCFFSCCFCLFVWFYFICLFVFVCKFAFVFCVSYPPRTRFQEPTHDALTLLLMHSRLPLRLLRDSPWGAPVDGEIEVRSHDVHVCFCDWCGRSSALGGNLGGVLL